MNIISLYKALKNIAINYENDICCISLIICFIFTVFFLLFSFYCLVILCLKILLNYRKWYKKYIMTINA